MESVFEVLSGGEALGTWEHQAALHREGLGESGSTTTAHPKQAAHRQEPGAAAGRPEPGEGAADQPAAEPAVTSGPEAPRGALDPDQPAGGSGPSPAANQVRIWAQTANASALWKVQTVTLVNSVS